MTFAFDGELAIDKFVERKLKHAGKQIDNSTLYAGSPMHYYCRHCDVKTDVLSEGHFGSPVTVCTACQALDAQGLMDDAKAAYAKATASGWSSP